MKNLFNFLLIVALLAVLTSCEKEETPEQRAIDYAREQLVSNGYSVTTIHKVSEPSTVFYKFDFTGYGQEGNSVTGSVYWENVANVVIEITSDSGTANPSVEDWGEGSTDSSNGGF